ncbi:hypothetical protein [Salinactinospora qingdaonensis]|uniref:Uncharacterized protein n=1 Tax=Salinactinospora qingdaonensis TaxID=702744 RepID=A0ABP7FDT9_9ACTN
MPVLLFLLIPPLVAMCPAAERPPGGGGGAPRRRRRASSAHTPPGCRIPAYADPGGFAEVAMRHHGDPWPEVRCHPGQRCPYQARDRGAGVEVRADTLDLFDEALRCLGGALPAARTAMWRSNTVRPYYLAWEQRRDRQAGEDERAELAALLREVLEEDE